MTEQLLVSIMITVTRLADTNQFLFKQKRFVRPNKVNFNTYKEIQQSHAKNQCAIGLCEYNLH